MNHRKMTTAALTALVFLAGCAATPTQAPAKPLAYTWEAENRVAKLQFHDNHAACTQRAGTISTYENCMVAMGYTRAQ